MTKIPNISIPFVERLNINEFLRDSPVISEVANILDYSLAQSTSQRPLESRMLQVFNIAYCMCTLATHPKGSLEDVNMISMHNTQRGCMSHAYILAWFLLKLHEDMPSVTVKKQYIDYFYERGHRIGCVSELRTLIRKYGGDSFTKPINFSGIEERKSKAPSEKNFNDKLKCAQSLIEDALLSANAEIEDLRAKLNKSEEERRREEEKHTATVSMLQSENRRFQRAYKDMEAELNGLREKVSKPIIKHVPVMQEVIKEVRVNEETAISKALCLDNVCKYAKSVPEDSDADVISTMVLTLCSQGDVRSADYWPRLNEIKAERESKKLKKQKTQSAPQFLLKVDGATKVNAYDIHDNSNVDRNIIE